MIGRTRARPSAATAAVLIEAERVLRTELPATLMPLPVPVSAVVPCVNRGGEATVERGESLNYFIFEFRSLLPFRSRRAAANPAEHRGVNRLLCNFTGPY